MLQGLLIAILIQSLLLAALCFTVRRGDVANRWLGVYFLTIAFQRIFHIVLRYSDWLHRHPAWVCAYEVSLTLGLWSLHCFALHLLGQPKRRASQIFVVLTGLFLAAFFAGFHTGHWADTEVYYHHPVSTIVGLGVSFYSIFVAWDSLRRIREALAVADFGEPRLRFLLGAVRWLLYYLVLRSLLALAFIAIRLTAMSDPLLVADMEHFYLVGVNLLLILLLAVIAYFALRNPAIFDHFLDKTPTVEQQVMLAILPEKEKNIIRPNVAPKELTELTARLRLFMEGEKPWLDPKLTQSKLAEKLDLPPYKLSLALHQGFDQHFNEFVNAYRVAYAQQLLANPDRARDTMYAVALDSGFASEAPFYAAFKKLTGESPAAWRERQKSS